MSGRRSRALRLFAAALLEKANIVAIGWTCFE